MTDHQSNKILMCVRYCSERRTLVSRSIAKGIMEEDYSKMSDNLKLVIFEHINKPATQEWVDLRNKLKDELMDKDILK